MGLEKDQLLGNCQKKRNSQRILGEVRQATKVSDAPAVFQRGVVTDVPAPRAGNAARTMKWPLKGTTRKSLVIY